jgi:hypothetical protein
MVSRHFKIQSEFAGRLRDASFYPNFETRCGGGPILAAPVAIYSGVWQLLDRTGV